MTSIRCQSDDLIEITFDDQASAEAAASQLRESGDWLEVVSGINTLAAQFDSASTDPAEALARASAAISANTFEASVPETIEIPVCYAADFAPDRDAVCSRLGISPEALVRLHTSGDHRVRMLGFAPGFAYVDGLAPELDVARLEQPRQRVAPGSVAIAGNQTGIYSMSSPGGWQVIGRTPMRLFDPTRVPPMLLSPGQPLRFRPVTADEYQVLAGR